MDSVNEWDFAMSRRVLAQRRQSDLAARSSTFPSSKFKANC